MIVEITSADVINWNAKTYYDRKVNEISNLIKTRYGEIPLLRGVGLSDEYIDKPVTVIETVLMNEVKAVVTENVEDVTVLDVIGYNAETTGDFIIKVVCEI